MIKNIEHIPVSKLVDFSRNSRTHSDNQITQLMASIQEFGFTNPILIDEQSMIIAGHGRVCAAKKMGIDAVPCVRITGLNEAQKRAYVIADNKLAMNAGWDDKLLAIEISELGDLGFDLSVTGFDGGELDDILCASGKEGLTDPDDVPAESDRVVSILGDMWVLGDHRIICGSSTDKQTVDRLLGGVRPHIMVTDPPYGVEYDASWRNKLYSKKIELATGKVLNDDICDWRSAYELFPGDVAYVWHSSSKSHVFAESLIASGFDIRAQIIWAKNKFAISRGHYHQQHEPCFYVVRKNKKGHWNGDRKQTTVWIIDKPLKSETGHSTQKPIECMKRPIENNSSPGHAVYEPFSGSGTTIMACEITGRSCYAIELNPAYVDIAVRRWQDYTGLQAWRDSDGVQFDQLRNA